MINLFLIPDVSQMFTTGSDYFDLPVSNFKLTDFQKNELLKYISKSGTALISTDIKILDPIITKYIINVSIIAYDDVAVDIIKSEITDKIGSYFIQLKRKDRVPKSDLISLIESINGVDSVHLNFIGQKNEEKIMSNNTSTSLVGLDEFNDIIIGLDEFPIIRGGWTDSSGRYYSEGLSDSNLGAVNIQIKSFISRKNI
jgi:hypothetical protein